MDSYDNVKDMWFCLLLQGKLLTFRIRCNINNTGEAITKQLIFFFFNQAGYPPMLLMEVAHSHAPSGNSHQIRCVQYVFNPFLATAIKDTALLTAKKPIFWVEYVWISLWWT